MGRLVARLSAARTAVLAGGHAGLPGRDQQPRQAARVPLRHSRSRRPVPGELADYTPFGYLRNPGHRARSWRDTSGGNLRTAPDYLGVEWVYPVGRDASSRVGLGLETTVDGRVYRSRADFDAIGVTSRYHTCAIMGFDWRTAGAEVEARFFLVDEDSLCVRLTLRRESMDSRRTDIRVVEHIEGNPPQSHRVAGAIAIDVPIAPTQDPRTY